MRTIVLDAGAFVAAERRDRRLAAFVAAAGLEGADILVPAAVIAEVWRDPPRQATVALLGTIDAVVPLDLQRARAVGTLLGKAGAVGIVDASVATLAVHAKPSLVLTSDPNDVQSLVRAAGATCSVGPRRGPAAAVLIERI